MLTTAFSKGTYIWFKGISDNRHESLFKRKPALLRETCCVGRRTVNQKKQVAEIGNDLDRILKPVYEWKQGQMEGSDLWHVIRISISIDFGYLADLKEGKYCKVMKCADDTKQRQLANTWQESNKTNNDRGGLELWAGKNSVLFNFGKA